MIQVIDKNSSGERFLRQAHVGETIQFRDGTLYRIGPNGELRTVRGERPKNLSPGRAARKARRAAEFARSQKKVAEGVDKPSELE